MKTGSIFFQPFQICERIAAITIQEVPLLKLLALGGSAALSPAPWSGCTGFLSGPTNYCVKGFVAYLETITERDSHNSLRVHPEAKASSICGRSV
jgi:hypothetical protein